MKALRIMIVEDEMILAMDLEDVLLDEGHEVVGTACDLKEALALAKDLEGAIDVAIMDVNLAHGSNGVETAGQLRAMWNIPSLFVSGNLDETTRARAEPSAPWGFIGKPYSPRELLAALSRRGARGTNSPPAAGSRNSTGHPDL